MTFGEKVRRLRKEKGWTQAELAKLSGLSLRTIISYEKGERAGRRVQGTQCAASLFVFYIPARRHPAAAVFDARHRAVARFQPAAQCFPQGIVHKLCDIIG